MNVCALDVVTRAEDFDAVASTLELRGWEWDFLHDVDGEATLGEIARRSGIDLDSAVAFVHEAMHRGLVTIPTMTLETYRLRVPTQTALRGASPALSLGTSALAEPPAAAPATGAISFSSDAFDWSATEANFEEPEDSADLAAAHETPGAVHYDDRFGVEHPGGPFATTLQHDEPFSAESHHEDDAFAVASHPEPEYVAPPSQHDEIPFAVTAGHDVEPLVAPANFHDEPFAVAAHHDEPVLEAVHHDFEPTFDPFAVSEHHEVRPAQSLHVDDPFAVAAHHDEPSAATSSHESAPHTSGVSHNGHTPVRFEDLFADAAPAAAPHDEPAFEEPASINGVSTNGHAHYEYVSDSHAAQEPQAPAHAAEALGSAPIHFDATAFDDAPIAAYFDDARDAHDAHDAQAVHEPHETHAAPEVHAEERPVAAHAAYIESEDAPPHDDTPGSISFSFSADDPADAHETYDAPGVRESPEVWTPPAAPMAQVPEPDPAPAMPEPARAQAQSVPAVDVEPAVDPRLTQTQSLYFEREAIDTDAGRELEAKVKNWKDSLSWREQQELNEASASGTEKAGVIGSLLRALGVR